MASLNTFLAFTIASFLIVAALFARGLCARGVAPRTAWSYTTGAVLLAYPFWFCFQRANMEIFVFLLLAGGVWALCQGKSYMAAICFGLATSLKIVPFVYLALFIPRRQYRQIGVGLLSAAMSTVAGLAYIGPTMLAAWHGIADGLLAFQHDFIQNFNPNAVGFDHTLVGIYRRFITLGPATAVITHRYVVVTAIVGLAIYLFRIRRLPFLNQLLCLSVAAIWLPPISFDYTLIHLYLGIALLAFASFELPYRTVAALFAALAILVSPLSEFILQGLRFGGQIRALVLAFVFIAALLRPLRTHYDDAVA